MKKWFLCLLFCAGLTANTAYAEPELGQQFKQVAKPIMTEDPEKIEVMEIFWYGCSHCYQLEKPLNDWVKKLPADVYFKRMPALGSNSWIPLSKAYFTIQRLEKDESFKPEYIGMLHTRLFDAIHKSKELPYDVKEPEINGWLSKQSGYDIGAVTFISFAKIDKELKDALDIFRNSGATGVPALIIGGKYITSPSMARGYDAALETASFLIEKIRKEKTLVGK